MAMISGTPSLFVWSLSEPQPSGIDGLVREESDHHWFYGAGKTALRDGLSAVADAGENVLVPAYLPDAVTEPVRELGLEPRYYAVESDLSPDLADLESRLDDRTVAAMSVNYFGFPQPGLDAFTSLLDEYDCYHVDDNAHSPLSFDGDTLLGTRGDIGLTSLWKLLPIPNGAILYLEDSIAREFDPSPLAGTAAHLDSADCRFVLKSLALDVLNSHATVKQSVDALVSGRDATTPADPARRYESSKTRMSALARRVVENADPELIRTARRRNYRAWRRHLADRSDLEFPFEELPPGVCPQVFPVYASDPDRFRRDLDHYGIDGIHTWPRLSPSVREVETYETANRLAERIFALPVHQHVDPRTIESVARSLATA